MTNQETIANLNMISVAFVEPATKEQMKLIYDTFDNAIKALEQEPTYYPPCIDCNKKMDEIRHAYDKLKEQEPSGDAISRQAVLDKKVLVELEDGQSFYCISPEDVETLPPVNPRKPNCKDCDYKEWLKDEIEPKTGHCKDCKWWKDSDGAFRRGIGAESRCPINREEVYEGNGYCYMFEPQEGAVRNERD